MEHIFLELDDMLTELADERAAATTIEGDVYTLAAIQKLKAARAYLSDAITAENAAAYERHKEVA